jgi:hypothetical protein
MTDGYLRFISTVGQTTVPFFGGVVVFSGCNLNSPKNMAGQTTVPIFSSSIFFRSYVSTIIGDRVKIRTPITTRKNYDPKKKRYSRLAGYVFRTTGKITTRKKRYSHLTDGWNKSQITVCRVKIRTHQLRLEKIMTGKKVQHSHLVFCRVKIRTPPITL